MRATNYFAVTALVVLGVLSTLGAARSEIRTLRAPDGAEVTINRDSYGAPHISADTETGVFFGQGFAVAEDRLYQLELHRRASEGKLSGWFGVFALSQDQDTRRMYYTPAERREIFAALPVELRDMLTAYTAGVNTYLDSMAANPAKYKPLEFSNREMPRWTVYKSVAVMQFLIRRFGQAGGDELDRLGELQQNGQQWLDENRPLNDPTAPTTIRGGSSGQAQKWRYSGIRVRPDVIAAYAGRRQTLHDRSQALGIAEKFGSFATLVSTRKSSSGNVMLLGAPQMGAPKQDEASLTHEVELSCAAFHVGGMTIAGVPFVIIGHSETSAWSMTSGVSDNSDVYIETTQDTTFGKYLFDGQMRDFEVFRDTIQVAGVPGGLAFTHYRTVHGPVFLDDLPQKQAFSLKMTFWKQELDMIKFALGLAKARNLREFETAAALNPMSFNLFYAGSDQRVKYWHVGKYQDRSDGVDPRLPHNGDGSEEWGGFVPFHQLPSADDTQQDYFVNWNNKPVSWWNNGDNIPWAGITSLTTRVGAIDAFVRPIDSFTYDNLKDIPRQISDHGTYQQAIEFTATGIIDENIAPPGQSGFISLTGVKSPHFDDQWPLHASWQFKDMSFGELVTGVADAGPRVPDQFALRQNYPNPFNPTTTISYTLPTAGPVRLEIFNVAGQRVAVLLDEKQETGRHEIVWDAAGLSSGLYVYKLTAGATVQARKSLLLK